MKWESVHYFNFGDLIVRQFDRILIICMVSSRPGHIFNVKYSTPLMAIKTVIYELPFAEKVRILSPLERLLYNL
jgi:hypothetical protein